MANEQAENPVMVGGFHDCGQAARAVEGLKRLGFRDDQLGLASRHDGQTGDWSEEGTVLGMLAAAGLGSLVGLGIMAGMIPAVGPVIAGGTLVAILADAAGGAAVAGLAGALIGSGISEDEARRYDSEFQAGRVLLTLHPEGRNAEAAEILRAHGAFDVPAEGVAAVPGAARAERALGGRAR